VLLFPKTTLILVVVDACVDYNSNIDIKAG